MATNLTEEQKKRNEEMRKIQRDQLAADAAQSGTLITDPLAKAASLEKPERLDSAVVYGSVPQQPAQSPAPAVAPAESPEAVAVTTTPEQRQEAVRQTQKDQLAADQPASPAQLEEAVATGTPVAVQEAQAANPEPAPAAENATTSPENATTSGENATTPAPAAPLTPQQQLAADIAKSGRPENLAPAKPLESTADPALVATAEAYRNMDKSFADLLQSQRDEYERKRLEGEQQVRDDQNAAKWTGLTELAASLANMIGVGEGNAVSQTYRPHSQDWMQKADASIKEHRSRMDNLRQRQRETEQKIATLKSEGALALTKARVDLQKQRAEIEYRKSMTDYQNARTEAARQEALMKAQKAEAEIKAIEALANQRDASARGNLIRAGATAQNAATRADEAANRNTNRDISTQSGANLRAAQTAVQVGRANQLGQSVTLPYPNAFTTMPTFGSRQAAEGNQQRRGNNSNDPETGLGNYR